MAKFEQLYPLEGEMYVPQLWEDEEAVPWVSLRPMVALPIHYDLSL